jgi:tripartite motif-containing protein 71
MRHSPHARSLCRTIALLSLVGGLLPAGAAVAQGSHASVSSSLARVRFIERGLGVQPPRAAMHHGKLHDPLFTQYSLRTQRSQKASIGFHDGTVIHLNENTDAILTSPHTTVVHAGEIAEYLAPGSDHHVQTATAVASAIGTTYDVRIVAGQSIFVVLHGALQVQNRRGTVLVTTNHQTTVRQGTPPTPPSPVDARAVFAWTDGIPTPDLGEDVSLDANGGRIIASSSQRSGTVGAVEHIHDGLLSQGWQSAPGTVSRQSVTVGFLGGASYRVGSVIIDPAATDGAPASEDLKRFAIRVSTTDTAASSFTTVLTGTCKQQARLQQFPFPVPVRARYVQLVVQSNYGDPSRVAVAEWEVAATESLFALPEGVATDTHGAIYVADTRANRIDKLSSTGKLLAHWGKQGVALGQFNRPSALAVDAAGNIYVADSGNNRVEKLSSTGKPILAWGSLGLGNDELANPKGIAIDGSGAIWVADSFGRVREFSPSGSFVKMLVVDPSIAFNPLAGLAIDPNGNLFTSEQDTNQVVELKPDGTTVHTFGGGAGPGALSYPQGLAVDGAGGLYVADFDHDRIVRFDTNSGAVTSWGQIGYRPGDFIGPVGVAVNHGMVYVADTLTSRIQRFTTSGKSRGVWGKNGTVANALGQPVGVAVDSHGTVYIVDSAYGRVQLRSSDGHLQALLGHEGIKHLEKGTALGQFYIPRGIAVDSQGAIYVADTGNGRVQILAPRGPIGAFGAIGSGPGKFAYLDDVAVDAHGDIYTTDRGGSTVQKFSNDGAYLGQLGVDANGHGIFRAPSGLAIDSTGAIYVADTGNGRLVKLSPSGTVLWTRGNAQGDHLVFAPQGVAVDTHDNVYVATGAGGVVQKLSPAGTVLQEYILPSPLNFATRVAVGPDGRVYVTNDQYPQVVVFAPTGELLDVWS